VWAGRDGGPRLPRLQWRLQSAGLFMFQVPFLISSLPLPV
jgi:hypothetical protein